MLDAAMMVIVLGTVAVALAVDVAVLVGWLRRWHFRKRVAPSLGQTRPQARTAEAVVLFGGRYGGRLWLAPAKCSLRRIPLATVNSNVSGSMVRRARRRSPQVDEVPSAPACMAVSAVSCLKLLSRLTGPMCVP
jgi:hypothetical protein